MSSREEDWHLGRTELSLHIHVHLGWLSKFLNKLLNTSLSLCIAKLFRSMKLSVESLLWQTCPSSSVLFTQSEKLKTTSLLLVGYVSLLASRSKTNRDNLLVSRTVLLRICATSVKDSYSMFDCFSKNAVESPLAQLHARGRQVFHWIYQRKKRERREGVGKFPVLHTLTHRKKCYLPPYQQSKTLRSIRPTSRNILIKEVWIQLQNTGK